MKLTVFLFILTFLYSCQFYYSTRINSYSDPDFINKKYNKIIVFADFNFNIQNQYFENQASHYLEKEMILSGSYLKFFPPTRVWQEADMIERLKKMKFDAFLQVSFEDINSNNIVIPGQIVTTVTKAEKKVDRKKHKHQNESELDSTHSDKKTITTERITTENIPDSYITESFIRFKFNLIDIKTNQIAWTGFAKRYYKGDINSRDFSFSILKPAAYDIVKQLKRDGHIYDPNINENQHH